MPANLEKSWSAELRVVTLIATRDRILHLDAVGKSDLAQDRRMRTDDVFWIASMST